MMDSRYDRNIRFFGEEGQRKLNNATIALVGCGGTGSHVAQQLAYLGMKALFAIDHELLDSTNINRYVIARHDDPESFNVKVGLIKRAVSLVNPEIDVYPINNSLISNDGFKAIKQSDYIFGCVDNDGIRFALNELCSAYDKPHIDIATDIISGSNMVYGGRVFINWQGNGCMFCMGLLDIEEVQSTLGGYDLQNIKKSVYGVSKYALSNIGPSVVSIRGKYFVTITTFRVSYGVLGGANFT